MRFYLSIILRRRHFPYIGAHRESNLPYTTLDLRNMMILNNLPGCISISIYGRVDRSQAFQEIRLEHFYTQTLFNFNLFLHLHLQPFIYVLQTMAFFLHKFLQSIYVGGGAYVAKKRRTAIENIRGGGFNEPPLLLVTPTYVMSFFLVFNFLQVMIAYCVFSFSHLQGQKK